MENKRGAGTHGNNNITFLARKKRKSQVSEHGKVISCWVTSQNDELAASARNSRYIHASLPVRSNFNNEK